MGRTQGQLLSDLEEMDATGHALGDRLRRLLVALALTEDVIAELNLRLARGDGPPQGHRQAAAVAVQNAEMYRQFLSRLAGPGGPWQHGSTGSRNGRPPADGFTAHGTTLNGTPNGSGATP
jgi:hypothetical protein